MDYDLTNENIKDLKDLVLITTQIYDIYCDLIDLEIAGLKSSRDYAHGLEILEDLLKQEKQIYSFYLEDGQVLSEFLKFVGKNEGYVVFDALSDVRGGSSKSLVKQRILEKLTNMLDDLANIDDINGLDHEEFNYNEEEYVEEDKENSTYDDDFDISVILDDQVKLDYLRTILKILDLCINDVKYKEIKHFLITYKYQLTFTLTSLESELLMSNFTIAKDLYWCCNAVAQMEKIEEDDILNCQDYYGDNVLLDEAINLVEMANLDKLEMYDIAEGILSSIYIRTALLFASSESIVNFEKTLKTDLKRKKLNPLIKQIIKEAFKNHESDKELPYKVSIRKLDK